jgi:hypothetical protein
MLFVVCQGSQTQMAEANLNKARVWGQHFCLNNIVVQLYFEHYLGLNRPYWRATKCLFETPVVDDDHERTEGGGGSVWETNDRSDRSTMSNVQKGFGKKNYQKRKKFHFHLSNWSKTIKKQCFFKRIMVTNVIVRNSDLWSVQVSLEYWEGIAAALCDQVALNVIVKY